MYKVQTNQISVPFAQLKTPLESPDLPAVSVPKQNASAAQSLRPTHSLIPSKTLAGEVSESDPPEIALPSSPPISVDMEKSGDEKQEVDSSNPSLNQAQLDGPSTPIQLSSPPPTEGEMDTGARLSGKGMLSLTSSVVKGEAANGLLELMKGGV